MSKINETNYPRRTQANYADTDMLVLQAAGGNTYTTRMEDMRDDYEATLAPTIDKINDALAPAENGATASQSYAIGEHFMRDGAFCTAIAAITSGGSFTLNTNYKVDDVANNLEQLSSDITNMITKKTYTLALTADASSPLGTFKAQEVTSDISSYGKIIAMSGYDVGGYPVIMMEQVSSNKTYIAASGKNAGNATVYVTFCKNTVIV